MFCFVLVRNRLSISSRRNDVGYAKLNTHRSSGPQCSCGILQQITEQLLQRQPLLEHHREVI